MRTMYRAPTMPLVLPIVFSLIGLALLAPALYLAYQSWMFLREAQTAPGTVIALQWRDDADGSSARPLVRYEVRGEPYELSGAVWSSPPAYAVGDQVRVRYLPGDTRAGRLESWFEFWFLPTLLGGMGFVFGLVGAGLWFVWIKARSRLLLRW